jgi:acetylornithine deacetylase
VSDNAAVGEAQELLAELVRIRSVNPRDKEGPAEGAIGEFVAGWLQEAGLDVDIQEVLPGRYNVIARLPGRDPGRTLLLEGHLDTVETDNMNIDPFAAQVRSGRLFGRGSCDAKGSLAAFMLALRRLAQSGLEPKLDVVLAAVVDEEYLGRGITHFMEQWNPRHRIVGAVIGLPTQLKLVIGHKGAIRFTVRTVGRPAHSAQPWEGDNAIDRMNQVMNFVRDHIATELNRVRHPIVGQPTIVVTGINGGRGGNVVPEECELILNRWTVPGEDEDTIWSRYKVAIEALAPGRIDVRKPLNISGWMETPVGANVVGALADILETLDLDAKAIGGPYSSDGGKMSPRIPCVLFGPGSMSDAHQANESIDLKQVVTAIDVVLHLAGRFAA